MHNPKKRQRDLMKRTLTYILMTFSVIVLVVVSLFLVLGYTVDKEGQPEQGGLLQMRSFPTGASVYFDGAKQDSKTNSKMNASAGFHNVKMELKKYRSWDKSFNLSSGELLWLNALLVPENINTTEAAGFAGLSSIEFSPNKNWAIAVEKPYSSKLKLIDLRDEKKPKVSDINIPEIAVRPKNKKDIFKVQEWDFSSRYALVSHTSEGKTEWIKIDRTDESGSRNISVIKDIPIKDAHFVGSSGNIYYVLSGGFVKKIDISDDSKKPVNVVGGVKSFELYKDDRIGYVGTKGKKQVVGFYDEAENKIKITKNFKLSEKINTSISSYFNDDYQAISYGGKVETVKNPLRENKVFAKFELKQGVKWLFFSESGRFLVAQNGSYLSVYDLERRQNFIFTIPNNPKYTLDRHIKWLDDFHLVSDVGGMMSIFEYDGTNPEDIVNVTPGYGISLSENGKRLFSVGKNTANKKPILQSSVMVIE